MRLVPIIFGLGIIVLVVFYFINGLGLFSETKKVMAQTLMYDRMMWITVAGLVPFLAYVWFVLVYLNIDIIRAILSIPGKLDKLRK